MSRSERFVVLGLGQARSSWFGELAKVANSGGLPLEFVKCVSTEEARVRLASGRAFSALLVDGGLPGVDRDLLDAARSAGAEALVVDDPRAPRSWESLGATTVLPRDFSAHDLLAALSELAHAIPRGVADGELAPPPPTLWSGRFVAVTGARGSGTSTIAAALAQGLSQRAGRAGAVLLADLALDASQGVLHHAPDIVPGLPELVDAHRSGSLSAAGVQSMVFDVEERGYHLLLGLRRRRGWAALRPRAVSAALDSLLSAYALVVGDVDPDVDGHHECGSFEVEERNTVARAALARASATVVVGAATVGGLHALARVLHDVCEHGVDPAQVVTVVNRAPRSPRERAAVTRALPKLGGLSGSAGRKLAAPVFVPDRRAIEDAVRDGRPLPALATTSLARAVTSLFEASDSVIDPTAGPVPVTPGTLGRWSDAEAAGAL